jgi:hypothetical protein
MAQAGDAPFKNRSLPASSLAEATGENAAAEVSATVAATVAMTFIKRVNIIFCI